MTLASRPAGRRERNKQEKLARIVAAAGALFAERGVDDVTTQQIADAADIGAGTLFLYARSKAELLLMVQNTHYREALESGRRASHHLEEPVAAIMAIVVPVVACNRRQVDNGRVYLREMVFGDPTDTHRAQALAIVADTEAEFTRILAASGRWTAPAAATVSRVVSAVMFVSMSVPGSEGRSVADIVADIERQVGVLLD